MQAKELQANGAAGQLHVSVLPAFPAAVAAAQRARHLINNTKVGWRFLHRSLGIFSSLAVRHLLPGSQTNNEVAGGIDEGITKIVSFNDSALFRPEAYYCDPYLRCAICLSDSGRSNLLFGESGSSPRCCGAARADLQRSSDETWRWWSMRAPAVRKQTLVHFQCDDSPSVILGRCCTCPAGRWLVSWASPRAP